MRGWVGLDGRPQWGGDRVPPRCENRMRATIKAYPYGILGLRLRLMRMGADKSAVGAVNRVHGEPAPTSCSYIPN